MILLIFLIHLGLHLIRFDFLLVPLVSFWFLYVPWISFRFFPTRLFPFWWFLLVSFSFPFGSFWFLFDFLLVPFDGIFAFDFLVTHLRKIKINSCGCFWTADRASCRCCFGNLPVFYWLFPCGLGKGFMWCRRRRIATGGSNFTFLLLIRCCPPLVGVVWWHSFRNAQACPVTVQCVFRVGLCTPAVPSTI